MPVGPVERVVLFFAIFLPCTVGFAILSYRRFEMPTMRFGRRLLRARPGKGSAVDGVSAGTQQART